tara:strand:- start:1237 stop:1740 length:504 start_codon:yes stop_codon:yes gene_type:complete
MSIPKVNPKHLYELDTRTGVITEMDFSDDMSMLDLFKKSWQISSILANSKIVITSVFHPVSFGKDSITKNPLVFSSMVHANRNVLTPLDTLITHSTAISEGKYDSEFYTSLYNARLGHLALVRDWTKYNLLSAELAATGDIANADDLKFMEFISARIMKHTEDYVSV